MPQQPCKQPGSAEEEKPFRSTLVMSGFSRNVIEIQCCHARMKK